MFQNLKNTWYSFPVQLLILHSRRHLFLVLMYVLLAMLVTKNLAQQYGIAYLFLNPEYRGEVSLFSFFLLGGAFGLFTVLWNITSYILNSHKFPFLATFRKPFFRFCLNNFIIPLSFVVIYLYALIIFQVRSEYKSYYEIGGYILAFCSGTALGFLVTISKSLNTYKKSYEEMEEEKMPRTKKVLLQPWRFHKEDEETPYRQLRVDYVFIYPWKVRRVRKVEHYRRSILIAVFRQHQKNALILELIALELVILLGFLMDYQVFRLPAAVSILLLISIIIGPVGAFFYWLRTWSLSTFVGLFLLYNLLVKFDFMSHNNSIYGLDYDSPAKAYNLTNIEAACTPDKIKHDSLLMISVLENWKTKMESKGDMNPKLVMVNATGGGLRSAVWGFYLMQLMDSVSGHKFYDNVQLITGASGGVLGQSYFRELYSIHKQNPGINLQSRAYLNNISKDLLNAVSFALVVNDLFIPWQKFSSGGYSYTKDRGYMWERQLNENTDNVMKKSIGEYYKDEQGAAIPLMIFTPTIINDARRFNISNFPTAFLDRPAGAGGYFSSRVDGIDAVNFFGEEQGQNISFTSAIRANSTFPFIMPNVYMPTEPQVQLMDAGLRDNFGAETTMRFLYTFRDWINQNTSGVVILQMRDYEKNFPPHIEQHPTLIQRKMDPISSIYINWEDYQDFYDDAFISTSKTWLNKGVNVISFEYIPSSLNNIASLSWHLTEREKKDILNAIYTPYNQQQLRELRGLMKY